MKPLDRPLGPGPWVSDDAKQKWKTPTEPRRFRGWTIVCHVPQDSPLLSHVDDVMDCLHHEAVPGTWSYQPANSLHMTIFPGLAERDLQNPETLPKWLTAADDILAINRECLRRIEAASPPPVGPLSVRSEGLGLSKGEVRVELSLPEEDQRKRVAAFRDAVRTALEWAPEGHEDYRFHLTFAYRLKQPDPPSGDSLDVHSEVEKYVPQGTLFDLEAPAFCVIDSMVSFPPILRF